MSAKIAEAPKPDLGEIRGVFAHPVRNFLSAGSRRRAFAGLLRIRRPPLVPPRGRDWAAHVPADSPVTLLCPKVDHRSLRTSL